MHYSIERGDAEEVKVYKQTAWSVTLEVTSDLSDDFPPEVFVFQTEGPEPDARAWFSTVATPADLQEYPTDAPAIQEGDLQQPYFRLNKVQFVSRNPHDIEQLIKMVERRVAMLEANLEALNNLS